MPKIRINNIQLYHEIYGEGYPLVMILGIQANISWWGRSLLHKISEKFKVIVYDNRGTGQSDNPNKDFDITDLVNDAKGLMDALGIEKAHIFGHSMGGMIALGLVLNYPERVNKLVLCSSYCGPSKLVPAPPDVREIINKPKYNLSPEQRAKNSLSIFYTPNFIIKHPKFIELAVQNMISTEIKIESYNRQLKAISGFDTCDKMKNIRTPTCVMHGRKDRLVRFQNGEILANLIPNSKLILFENSAHVPYIEERDMFLKNLIEFLW